MEVMLANHLVTTIVRPSYITFCERLVKFIQVLALTV